MKAFNVGSFLAKSVAQLCDSVQLINIHMGFGYVSGATPVVDTASLQLKVFDVLEGARIEVARPKLESPTHLFFSSTVKFLGFL
jgi:hypothetical protein